MFIILMLVLFLLILRGEATNTNVIFWFDSTGNLSFNIAVYNVHW